MFSRQSLAGRIMVAKSIGFAVGALAFFALPDVGIQHEVAFRFGLWIFYTLLGVVIALVGVLTVHPLGFRLNFWLRGAAMGFIFHLMLVLIAYDEIAAMMVHEDYAWLGFVSPFWILIDGVVLGVLISFITTKIAGEGSLPQR